MDLEKIRREYLMGGLSEGDLDANPFIQFRRWLDIAIDANLAADPTAMTLATVSPDGQPSQRVVLLKGLDEQGFVFYTNLGSRKAGEIGHNPKVCLHFGWLPLERQVIVYGEASKLSIAEATHYFVSRPHESQLAAWSSRQSSRISSRQMLEEMFEQMKRRFKEGEVPLPSFWGGFRVKPSAIEFWQGRANRLHDRLMYRRQPDDAWTIERLQP
ncbi:MAG: pyridoxamine 5'-phosphate oxidase [Hahellaceae bacterium]|jgi:pyridoxamine 5'-phosphate oxidase|nr:pyridoxamine 5'-phosphate oxidase [Hahellaceae bacterium]